MRTEEGVSTAAPYCTADCGFPADAFLESCKQPNENGNYGDCALVQLCKYPYEIILYRDETCTRQSVEAIIENSLSITTLLITLLPHPTTYRHTTLTLNLMILWIHGELFLVYKSIVIMKSTA